jgi:hypothetical protein
MSRGEKITVQELTKKLRIVISGVNILLIFFLHACLKVCIEIYY